MATCHYRTALNSPCNAYHSANNKLDPRYRLYAVSLQIELELTVELLCCVYNLPQICSISPARLSHCLLSNIAIAEENIYYLPQNRVRECHHVIAVSRRYINPSLIKYIRHGTALNF